MHSLILPFCIIAVVFIAVTGLRRAMAVRAEVANRAKPPYVRRKALLNGAERSFAGTLESVLPEGIRVMAKVRLADVVQPRTGLSTAERAKSWNRLNQRCVDFLLVRRDDFAPVGAIELEPEEDKSTRGPNRDESVAEVCRIAELPLIRFPASDVYSPSEVRRKITEALAPTSRG